MTDKVMPSFGRTARSREYTAALAYGAGSADGVVWDDGRLVEDSEGDLATGALNAFAESHSSSSFDVTIDTGEAIVRGAYLARDTTTTVTLSSSTSNQTVYLGWKDGQADTVIIGDSSSFGTHDPSVAIWTFDTDGSGVTSVTDERDLVSKGYIAGSMIKTDVKGIQFTQTSEPVYDEGANWVDPGTGIYYAGYDDGSGGDWHPIPPVTITEEAATFAEGDVSVSYNSTEVSNESVVLVNTSPTSRSTDNTSGSTSDKHGLEINPNEDMAQVAADISSNTSGHTTAYVTDTGGSVLASTDISGVGSGGSFSINQSLSSGTSYYLVVDAGGSSYTLGQNDSDSHPTTGDKIDIEAGVYNGTGTSTSDSYTVNNVREYESDQTSGDAVVSWSSPSDIESWDLATWQRTLNNETVTIDVLDGSGNVLHSDIPQNFDISTVSNSTNIQLRVNLSRSSTSNNPSCDYLARRFVR